ncbi:hypothetical protein WMY93_029937 [Mugilogobius chulae]|uniref:Uncharacterized protein n=1 Tax=Mugilogobius chulae TaxID=88201 RepID=A0AAW0MT56_9GOBI
MWRETSAYPGVRTCWSWKSSFINSVASALYERMYIGAETRTVDSGSRSHTLKYETHPIYRDGGLGDETYPFVFNDMMGMEGGDRIGIHPTDIKLAMQGHVKEGYTFNPMSPLSKDNKMFYNDNPTIDDKVHVLVLMLSANCTEIDASIIQKMKEVRETAHHLGIPQIAVGTHIDEQCPEIKNDIKDTYRSKSLKIKMEEFSKAVELSLNCIFAVKNYSEEIDIDDNVDTLILTVLRNMVYYGLDFVRKQKLTSR